MSNCDEIQIGSPPAARAPVHTRGDTVRIWKYKGRYYAKGIGTMYAQEGLPLAVSFDRASVLGVDPCMNNTVAELMENGMALDRARRLVKEGYNDMVEPVHWWWGIPSWMSEEETGQ